MTGKFEPDYSLIREWNRETAETLPHDGVFVSCFQCGAKQLHYVAAQHESGIASPTLQTVKREFDSFRPDVVIVEGVPYTGETSPAWYLDHCRAQAKNDFAGGGESAYATVLAADRGIAFVPGEPSEHVVFDTLRDQGFTRNDFLGWHAARMIRQELAANNKIDIAGEVKQAADNYLQVLDIHDMKFDFEDFAAWYEGRMGKAVSLESIADDDFSPSSTPDAGFLQKMTQAADKMREPHILKIISEQLRTHDRVLVVFGSAHLAKQLGVLTRMMGAPQHFKIAQDFYTL